MASERTCQPYEGCRGEGWMWDPEDSGSGRTVYCTCAAGEQLRKADKADGN